VFFLEIAMGIDEFSRANIAHLFAMTIGHLWFCTLVGQPRLLASHNDVWELAVLFSSKPVKALGSVDECLQREHDVDLYPEEQHSWVTSVRRGI
jgi:hypothetical protein